MAVSKRVCDLAHFWSYLEKSLCSCETRKTFETCAKLGYNKSRNVCLFVSYTVLVSNCTPAAVNTMFFPYFTVFDPTPLFKHMKGTSFNPQSGLGVYTTPIDFYRVPFISVE